MCSPMIGTCPFKTVYWSQYLKEWKQSETRCPGVFFMCVCTTAAELNPGLTLAPSIPGGPRYPRSPGSPWRQTQFQSATMFLSEVYEHDSRNWGCFRLSTLDTDVISVTEKRNLSTARKFKFCFTEATFGPYEMNVWMHPSEWFN